MILISKTLQRSSVELLLPYHVKNRRRHAHGTDCRRDEQNAHGFASEGGEIKEWRSVVNFIFVFDLALLVLQVKDCASLRVVERRRPVEGPQEKSEEHCDGDGLQSQSPTYRAELQTYGYFIKYLNFIERITKFLNLAIWQKHTKI
jgi:hypothetical protein